jgi:starch-binding outer membrane protein, SusD/RagB family
LPATTSQSSAAYPFNEVVFWANRDPRFDATIAWNGAPWPLSGKTDRKQWTYVKATYSGKAESTKPFYVKRFSSPGLASSSVVAASDLGGNGYDWIEYRFAELILDYAEAANETGKLSLAKDLVRQIRIRAGIVAGDKDYGLDLAIDQDKMRDLILNERMVEFAFEGKRNDDLRRTRRMHLLQGTLAQMTQIQTVSTAMFNELEKPIGTNTLGLDPNTPCRDTVNMYNPASVQKYFKFPYSWSIPAANGNFAMPEYYYFFPLSSQFLNSTPLLNQTIGWDGGTFDPLSE